MPVPCSERLSLIASLIDLSQVRSFFRCASAYFFGDFAFFCFFCERLFGDFQSSEINVPGVFYLGGASAAALHGIVSWGRRLTKDQHEVFFGVISKADEKIKCF